MTVSELMVLAREAPQDLLCWSSFVAQTEFARQNSILVSDAERWQTLWFEMEIVNALALAEWEDDGRPCDWSRRWREGYEQDAKALVSELLPLLVSPEAKA
ncbi:MULTISPECIES: hypothetical protein [Pseudomonas]|jgi:hypothetical protein|nr:MULTISPECIES: hypothetical protein [unclassified Pseudomonas]